MKILCYSTSHDSNFTFYDTEEGKIRYYSIERMTNVKHATCNVIYFIKYVKFHFGFDIKKDIIIRTLVPEVGDIDCFSPLKEDKLFVEDKPNYFVLDHHYAHVLSSLALNPNCNVGIAVDGVGNFDRSVTIFRNLNNIKETTFEVPNHFRFGSLFNTLAKAVLKQHQNISFDIRYMEDFIGKLMGLQSYGKMNSVLYNTLNSIGIENTKELRSFFYKLFNSFNAQISNNNFDDIYTCHQWIVDNLVFLFKQHFSKTDQIAYSGGCALSTVTNTQLLDAGFNLTVCPAANDSGLSLGLLKFADLYFNLGIDFSNIVYTSNMTEKSNKVSDKLIKFIAEELSNNKIIAYTEGPCEVGPRALGHRSILMNPSITNGKNYINEKVKHREWWRPFGGSCINTDIFENYSFSNLDYYMLRNFKIKEEWRNKLNAICHVDNSTRMQVLYNEEENLYKIIKEFYNITGIPAILNTSFNIAGKPIANYKEHIFEAFKEITNVDYLVYNGEIYIKKIIDNEIKIVKF